MLAVALDYFGAGFWVIIFALVYSIVDRIIYKKRSHK